MSPRKRNKENEGLPRRWRFRHGAYYYQVPPGQEAAWNGKREFRLGSNLGEAYRAFAARVDRPDELRTMGDVINRYMISETPRKSVKTQTDEIRQLELLKSILGDAVPASITTRDVYKIYTALKDRRGLTFANRVMERLSHVLTMSIRWGARADHPMTNRKFVKETPKPQHHIPELYEIRSALTIAPELIQHYVRLKLLTGLRMTDLLSLKRTDIQNDGIHVTPSKTAASSGKSVIIEFDESGHLESVIGEIRAMPRAVSSNHLFCTRRGQPYIKPNKSVNGFQSLWQRWQNKALKAGLIERKFSEKALRNRVATDQDSAEDAARLLAHSDVRTTKKHYRSGAERVAANSKLSVLFEKTDSK